MPENNPIKVAHIITRFILGGAQENTLHTVKGLKDKPEYEVCLISGPPRGPEGSLIEEAEEKGIKPIIMDSLRRDLYPWLDLKSLFVLYNLIKKGKYSIVHTHSSKAGILGRIAAWLARSPIIIHTIHGLPFHEYQGRILNFIYVNLERLVAPITDKIITVCDRMAEKAYKARVASRDKFITVYSGMELDDFIRARKNESLRRKLGIKDDELVIGKIARLFPLKGHPFLLEAAAKIVKEYPKVKFLLVGEGILRESLEKRAVALGVRDKIVFAGLVPREQIPEYISLMDIVVHTSLREGLARVIPQAFAEKKPVVSFQVDGADEFVRNKQTGFLVQPYDIDGLTEAIISLLKDRNLRERMGAEGKELVDPKFRVEEMVSGIDSLYKKLLQQKGII